MTQLQKYLRKWSLETPQLLAQTHTSEVYLVKQYDTDVVLKLLNEVGIRDEQRGAIALYYYDGQGAVKLLNASEDAHLLEYLQGDELISLVNNGDDDDAAKIIASVVKKIHSAHGTTDISELHTLRRRFRSLFQLSETNAILQHGAQLAEKLLDSERNKVVLHGDIHHWNICNSKRGWLAFDPKGLFGESTYDVANALMNPYGMPQLVNDNVRFLRHVQIYSDTLEIPRQRIINFAFAHACLSITWSMEDNEDYHEALAYAQLIEKYVSG